MRRPRFLFAAVAMALAVLAPSIAHAWTRVDTTLTMSDGIHLAVTYFLPSRAPEPGGHPAIILMHGFDVQGTAKGAFTDVGEPGPRHADSGYVALAYTVRGMGIGENASEGVFDWFTGTRELQDLREIIAWLGARDDVDDQRIALEGLSQGGLMAWGGALEGMPVRCIVPMASVPNYAASFVADGGFNYLVQTFLSAATVFRQNIRLGPFLRDSLMRAFSEDRYGEARELIARRDLAGREADVALPVFMQCAWHDDIFSSGRALCSFHALGVPKKLLMWPGAHGWPPPQFGPLRDSLTYRFYRRWLRDDPTETIMDSDSALVLIDGATGTPLYASSDDSASWLPQTTGGPTTVRLHLSNGAILTGSVPSAPVIEFRSYVMNVSDDSIPFRSAPFGSDETFIAAGASLVVNSSAATYQANTLLWDYDPATDTRTPVMRGCRQLRGNDAHERERVSYELDAQLYTVRAGHQIEAWVKFGTNASRKFYGIPFKSDDEFGCGLFPPQESANDTLFSSAEGPSFVELRLYRPRPAAIADDGVTGATATSLRVTPTVAHAGTPIVVTRSAIEPADDDRGHTRPAATLELVSLAGAILGRWHLIGAGRLIIPTDDLPAGGYLLSSGAMSTRIVICK